MLTDIYVLATERTAVMVERFLARFVPYRERADADYTVRLSDKEIAEVFASPELMAAFCESHLTAGGRGYWLNRSAFDPHSAHVFFLHDGGLVLGLSVAAQDDSAWSQWLEDLRLFAGAAHGYWICECPPEDTVTEFIKVSKRHAEAMAAGKFHR